MIGRGGETLRSIQYVVSMALRSRNAALVRVNVDIADYKKQRAEKLAEQATEWINQVVETGEPYIARINAADRRIVHRVVSQRDDVETHSEGEGRDRAIVISRK